MSPFLFCNLVGIISYILCVGAGSACSGAESERGFCSGSQMLCVDYIL
jgi:hypothetical protein